MSLASNIVSVLTHSIIVETQEAGQKSQVETLFQCRDQDSIDVCPMAWDACLNSCRMLRKPISCYVSWLSGVKQSKWERGAHYMAVAVSERNKQGS